MKKLTLICALTLGFSLLISPVLAAGPPNFHFDFNADDVYETSWNLSVGEKVSVEIFVGEWDEAYSGEPIFGVRSFFYYDNTKIKVNESNSFANDSKNGGPFDSSYTDKLIELEPGKYRIGVAAFDCVPVEKDRILIYTFELEAIAPGEATIEIKTDYSEGEGGGFVSNGGLNCKMVDTGDAGNGMATISISGSSSTTSQTPTPTTTTTSSGSSGTTSIADTTTSLPNDTTTTTSTGGSDVSSTTTTIDVPPPSSTTSIEPNRCPIIEAVGVKNISVLDSFRNFRDLRLAKSANGTALICLYYMHGEEVSDIFSSNPGLSARVREIIFEIAPALEANIQNGTDVIINSRQYTDINDIMKDIMNESSPGLRSTVLFIMKQLNSDKFMKKVAVTVENN